MPIWIDVDTAIELFVNADPLVASGDGFTIDEGIAFNEAGMDLNWNFITPAGVVTQTNVVPTAAGDYDWAHVGNGEYKIEMTASGGASADNDTEGFGWFTGVCDAVLPWRSPTYGFRAAALNDALIDGGDNLDVNVVQWLAQAVTLSTGNQPDVNVDRIDDVAVSTIATAGKLHVLDDEGNTVANESKQDTIDGILDDLKLAYILVDTTIATAGRSTTSCRLTAGSDNNDAYIGMRVILDDDAGDGEYVSRTITDYVATNKVVTWSPAITEIAEDGGQIYIVPGDTVLSPLITTVDGVVDSILSQADDNFDEIGDVRTDVSTLTTTLLRYVMLMVRKDAAIKADAAAYLTAINTNLGSGAGSYDNETDSKQAVRDRGDLSWITGGGGGITDILNIQVLIPNDVDLADTATVRIGLGLTNMLDDLPSTAEITPGTITIDRKAIGGTSWTNIVNGAACSEAAGLIYYDEVFDDGTGYAEGDSIRITFKSQKITVAANDYEITGTDGWIFQTSIRQTVPGAAGSEEWEFTLTESGSGEPVADANVWVTADEAGEGAVIISGFTDALGAVTFWLDAGTYYFWCEKSGWNFSNPYETEVS